MLRASKNPRRILLWTLLCFTAWPHGPSAVAQQVLSGISAKEAYVDSDIVLRIQVRNAEQHRPPELPEIDGLKIVSAGTPSRSSNLSIINGRRQSSSTVTYSFVITLLREGTFTIPAVELEVDGRIQTTEPHTIVVNTSETGDLLFAEISCDAQQAYVGQAVRLQLKIWVRPYSDRGFEYRFSESDMWQQISRQTDWGIFADRLETLAQNNQRPAGQEVLRKDAEGVSRAYLLYEIEDTMYPKRPGKIDPGNVRIVVNYPTKLAAGRSGFFGDDFLGPSLFDQLTRRRAIQIAASRPISVEATLPPFQVLDVPAAGRPVDYRGAVGKYRLVVQAEPRRVKVGDPISLRMLIQGDGPMDLVQAPPLPIMAELTRDFKVDDKSLAGFVQGDAKLFTTSIRPLREDVVEIPPIPFSYFDPDKREFFTSKSDPISISVAANESLSLDSIVAHRRPAQDSDDTSATEEPSQDPDNGILPLDRMLQPTTAAFGSTPRTPWWLFALAPICCVAAAGLIKWRSLANLIQFRQNPIQLAMRAVREASHASQIRDALNLPTDDLTDIEALRQIQRECDAATFGGTRQSRPLRELKAAALRALQHSVVLALLCCLLYSSPLSAQTPSADGPALRLNSQQIETLLAEALAAQQEARQREQVDPVAAQVPLERAIAKYELVVEAGYQSAAVYRNLADALVRKGQLGKALAMLEQTRRWTPRDPSISNRIREIRKQLGASESDTVWNAPHRQLQRFLPSAILSGAAIALWSLACVLVTGMVLAPRFRRRRYVLMTVGMTAASTLALWLLLSSPTEREGIAVADVSLRSADGKAFAVIANLQAGDPVCIHEQRGGWLLVESCKNPEEAGWTEMGRVRILR